MSQYSLSVLCHFAALADCIRYGYLYVGGQLVITRNILSSPFDLILLVKYIFQKGGDIGIWPIICRYLEGAIVL